MKNRLSDLNNHLFAEVERLSDEQLKGEKLQEEITRSKALSSVATQIIDNARLALKAMTAINEGLIKNPLKLYRTRRVGGVSPGAIWQLVFCCLIFSGYYLGNGHVIALALNILLLATAIAILALYYKYNFQKLGPRNESQRFDQAIADNTGRRRGCYTGF